MKKIMPGLVALILLLSGTSNRVLASTIVPFTDGPTGTLADGKPYYVWPGLQNIAANPTQDTYGIPNLVGGSFDYTGHTMSTITLDYQDNITTGAYKNSAVWNSVSPKDWFFDINPSGSTEAWDYVVHANKDGSYELYYKQDGWGYGDDFNYKYNSGTKEFYKTSTENVTTTTYDKKGRAHTSTKSVTQNVDVYDASSSSYGTPRTKHPVAASAASLKEAEDLGKVAFSGWASYTDAITGKSLESSWDLSQTLDGGIDLDSLKGQTIRYGFALSCANDVLYGQTAVPSPEPAPLALMGAGALGMALLLLRKKSF